jgi:hypothetical protein
MQAEQSRDKQPKTNCEILKSVKPSFPKSLAEKTFTPRLFKPSTMALLTLSSA